MKSALVALLFLSCTVLAGPPRVITRLPYTINVPGIYLLGGDRAYAGNARAIVINADNVYLDLRGYTITGSATISQASETAAVFAQDRRNITITNGTIRGFARGVYLEGTAGSGHVVEKLLVDQSTFLGIQVKGDHAIVRQNRVNTVKGATFATLQRFGIHLTGRAIVAEDNSIFDIYPDPSDFMNSAYGLFLENGRGSVIVRNRVQNTLVAAEQLTPTNYCLYVKNSRDVLVAANQCTGVRPLIFFDGGGNQCSGCVFRDNSFLTPQGVGLASLVKDGGGNVSGN